MAACGTCAAGRTHAAHRRAHGSVGNRPRRASLRCGILAGITGIGLERRPQRDRRYPLVYCNSADARKYAAELVTLAPDVILAHSSTAVA
jgi:hypothetical protein